MALWCQTGALFGGLGFSYLANARTAAVFNGYGIGGGKLYKKLAENWGPARVLGSVHVRTNGVGRKVLYHYEWAKRLAKEESLLNEALRGFLPKGGMPQPLRKQCLAWIHQHYLDFGADRRPAVEKRPGYVTRIEGIYVTLAPCTRRPSPPEKVALEPSDPNIVWFQRWEAATCYVARDAEIVPATGYTGRLLGQVTGEALAHKLERFLSNAPADSSA